MLTLTMISKPFGSGNYKSVTASSVLARWRSSSQMLESRLPSALAEQKLAISDIASAIDTLRANQFGPKG